MYVEFINIATIIIIFHSEQSQKIIFFFIVEYLK